MDYWNEIDLKIIDELTFDERPCYFFSTKGTKSYHEAHYEANARLIFGSESGGLPIYFHKNYANHFYTIPMKSNMRSLNLSNAAAIVLYEALRQDSFKQLVHL